MGIKHCIFDSFQEEVILLCQSILEIKRMPDWYSLAHFTIPLKPEKRKFPKSRKQLFEAGPVFCYDSVLIYVYQCGCNKDPRYSSFNKVIF